LDDVVTQGMNIPGRNGYREKRVLTIVPSFIRFAFFPPVIIIIIIIFFFFFFFFSSSPFSSFSTKRVLS
jgi:hypothetical protein